MRLAAFAIATGAAFAVGCTLLATFDVPADGTDGEDSGTSTVPDGAQSPNDSGGGGGTPEDASTGVQPGFPPECEAPPTVFGLCSQVGMVCARRINNYPAVDKDNDILECEGDGFKAFTCTAKCPSGCVNVDNFDDQCDPCKDRADGTYCGRDVGWTKRNADVGVRCKGSKLVSTAVCGTNNCESKCTRANPELPSCCR